MELNSYRHKPVKATFSKDAFPVKAKYIGEDKHGVMLKLLEPEVTVYDERVLRPEGTVIYVTYYNMPILTILEEK